MESYLSMIKRLRGIDEQAFGVIPNPIGNLLFVMPDLSIRIRRNPASIPRIRTLWIPASAGMT